MKRMNKIVLTVAILASGVLGATAIAQTTIQCEQDQRTGKYAATVPWQNTLGERANQWCRDQYGAAVQAHAEVGRSANAVTRGSGDFEEFIQSQVVRSATANAGAGAVLDGYMLIRRRN